MRKAGLWIMSIFYIAAGINHFIHPAGYLRIMPHYLPWHSELVIISGVAEIVLGALLLPLFSRRIAALGIIVLLIAVFPANIQMAQNFTREHHPYTWLVILRLPLQVLLIWWAWQYTRRK